MSLGFPAHIRSETEAFVAAARGNLEAPVPSCPGWTVKILAGHVWEVFSFWGQIAERRLQSYRDAVEPERPGDEEVLDEIARSCFRFLEVVTAADPATPIWTWSSDKTIGFLPRRIAHEMSVHRWDCENAVGSPAPVEAEMAWDGVAEFFENFFAKRGTVWEGDPLSVALRRTDTDQTLVAGPPGAPPEPALEVGGHPSDLLLAVWGRLPLGALAVRGDPAAWDRLLAACDTT